MELLRIVSLLTVFMILFECCETRKGASKHEKHFKKKTVDIRDITDSKAVMDWTISRNGKDTDSFKVSCKSSSKEVSPLEYIVEGDADHVVLKNLKPATTYSCSLSTGDEDADNEWKPVMDPIKFTTKPSKSSSKGSDKPSSKKKPPKKDKGALSTMKTMATKHLALLLSCILVPVLLFAACIGGCLIFCKVRSCRKNKQEAKRHEKMLSLRKPATFDLTGVGVEQVAQKDNERMADQIRAKYNLPASSKASSGTNNGSQPFEPIKIDLATLSQNRPSLLFDELFSVKDNDVKSDVSEISSYTELAAATLSKPLLSVPTADSQVWSEFMSNTDVGVPHRGKRITLDDLLPPFPPPSEQDIVT